MSKTLKKIFAPHLGHDVKMGRVRRPARGPRLCATDFLLATLPDPADTCDYSEGPQAAELADIYLNGDEGDCVIAGGYHLLGLMSGLATGTAFHATKAQINHDYSAIGGYVPGDEATDQGCNEVTALDFWGETGFADGTKLLGNLAVDATNQKQVMQLIDLFQNVVFGIELPDTWVSPFPSSPGFVWDDGAPDENNGHCVVATGYDKKKGVQIDSWGLKGWITWNAVAHLASPKHSAAGELHVALFANQVAKAATKAPNGVAWADLISMFNSIGGHVPAPNPTPLPPPSGPITLAKAQSIVKAALAKGPILMTRGQAEQTATAGLAASWPAKGDADPPADASA